EYRFNNSPGGYPGNEDSGAMSSWYCWNSMGIFPIAGQDIFLIGSPTFQKVSFAVRGNTFEIITKNNSLNNIYIQSATLNGKPYNKPYLHFEDLEKGGQIVFEMGKNPSDWGANQPPPSYEF
ncbi:MAG TPA: glycoside hydrolase domain-containing protein, partial [Draconibacterium sp.]|nr:glycoside hydrolase domain-containing protein [Draconibacterium sp.]